MGRPRAQEIPNAVIETLRDSQIISNKSVSNDRISLNESAKMPTYFYWCFPIITAAAGKIHVT